MTSSSARTFRIATRSSPLALWQANHVAGLVSAIDETLNVELVHVSTLGDRDRTEALAQFGGQGVFTREVQKAVLNGDADIAVHSLKDLPTEANEGLILAGVPERAPRFDALVLPVGQQIESLDELPSGARIGTGSPRRQAQLLAARPDLVMQDIRGNVETRLRKLDDGEYDAIILACAGMIRLGMGDRISLELQPPVLFPAVGQAALGIECRADDEQTERILQAISNETARAEVLAERACLATLRAGCHAPVGTLASIEQDELTLTGVVLSLDGKERFESTVTGSVENPAEIGERCARQLIEAGAVHLLTPSGDASA
ncbi:MAG: hydroxymethylbilane synthase [Planctomycetaceae bacterium]|nr:hydroxymethylbilane synthase [Planctomycetaceae bacterium]